MCLEAFSWYQASSFLRHPFPFCIPKHGFA
jgi:hypothetical protein